MSKETKKTPSQVDKFKTLARDVGCDEDEDKTAFDEKLRRLSQSKTPRAKNGSTRGASKRPK